MSILAVGIDGGGTKTLVRWTDGVQTQDFKLGPANVQRLGVDKAARLLVDVASQVTLAAGRRPDRVVAGLAGAGLAIDQERLLGAAVELAPDLAGRLSITHDAAIALVGAHQGRPGGLLLSGTGSIALVRSADGEIFRAGGWGYLLGDEGSGTRLGIAALQIAMHTLEGGRPSVVLDLLSQSFGLSDTEAIIRNVYRQQWPVAQAAPLLLRAVEAGDLPAREALWLQTQAFARQAVFVLERAGLDATTFALAGGLSNEATYRTALMDAVRSLVPGAEFTRPSSDPVDGALLLACEQAG